MKEAEDVDHDPVGRLVNLADSLVNVLAEHVATYGTTGKERWLFAGEGEDPPHQNTVGYWWRKPLRDAGLSGVKLNDLRHFYASGLKAAGCDVVTVQRSLGHSKATTTLNTYAFSGRLPRAGRGRRRSRSCWRRSARTSGPSSSPGQGRVSEPLPPIADVLRRASPCMPPVARHSAHKDARLGRTRRLRT